MRPANSAEVKPILVNLFALRTLPFLSFREVDAGCGGSGNSPEEANETVDM